MILIPVSIGELLDKISILQIKLLEITDVSKLAFIRKEHSLLMNTLSDPTLINHPKYHQLIMKFYEKFLGNMLCQYNDPIILTFLSPTEMMYVNEKNDRTIF